MKLADHPTTTGMPGRGQLNIEAAAAAVAYIAKRVSNPSFHKIFKVLYLAEKDHLGRYGRMIVGDSYHALENGPVPSALYDSFKSIGGRDVAAFERRELTERLESLVQVRGSSVVPIGEPDLDWLSDSDVECLDEAIKRFGTKSFRELTDITHDAAWHATPANGSIRLDSIAESLPNAEDVLSYLRGEDED